MTDTDAQDSRGSGARISVRPRQYTKTEWKDAVLGAYRRMDEANLSLIAAGVGFYAFLSMFPALAAIIAIWGYWADPALIQDQIAMIEPMLPDSAFELVQKQATDLVAANKSTLQWTTILSILLAIWSARTAVASLIRGLNAVHDKPHRQSAIRRLVVAVALTGLLVLVAVFAFASVVIVPPLIGFLQLSGMAEFAVGLIKWAALLAVVLFAMALVYRYGPNRRGERLRWLTPGAIAAVALWTLGSLALATYFRNFGSLNEIYGSLGAVVGLMFWFWFSALVTLLGAQLNAELERMPVTSAGGRK